jgi:cation transport ATPase
MAVFDKTGTLTLGAPKLDNQVPAEALARASDDCF